MAEVRIEMDGGAIYAPDWEAVAKLSAKISAVMAELEPMEKDGTNTHFKYKFLSYEQLAATIHKLIPAHGLSFTWGVDNIEHGNATYLSLEVTFIDNETGAVRMMRWVGEGQDGQDKGTAKALTACVKYGLMRTFLTTDQDDVDSDRDGPAAQPKPRTHWAEDEKNVRMLLEMAESNLGLSDEDVYSRVPRKAWPGYASGKALYAKLKELAEAEKPAEEVRPPEKVREWVQAMAGELVKAEATATDGQRGLCVAVLEGLFPGEQPDMRTQCRYSLLKYLWDVDSIKDCTDAQVLAMLDWAGIEGANGKTISDPDVMGEAQRIHEVGKAAGQQELV